MAVVDNHGSEMSPTKTDVTIATDEPKCEPDGANNNNDNVDALPPFKLISVLLALCFASFFAGYDATCVGTLTPLITDEFHSINDVSWYGIAYSLATCATILTYGKLYAIFTERYVFVSSLIIFVVGSIVCATGPSSLAFILGRAIAGLGNAGILSGCNIIIARVTPLRWRPFYQSLVGGIECAALASAPLIAGAIAKYQSWRVCFYISIPFGAVPAFICLFFLRIPPSQRQQSIPSAGPSFLRQLDVLGMALFVPMIVCLILALQWGGTIYAWSNFRVILPLVVAGGLCPVFIAQQYYARETATLPIRLLSSRTLVSGIILIFATAGTLYVFTYYLPIYYQAIRDASVLGSGLRDLSRMLGLVVALLVAGSVTSFIGYYTPSMLLGAVLMSVGAGLTSTFHPSTRLVQILVSQAIFGLGCGFAFQQAYVAVQVVLPSSDIPAAISILTFAQFLGSIVMLAVSQNVFSSHLISGLGSMNLGLNITEILNSGAVDLKNYVPVEKLPEVLQAYNAALDQVFYVGLGAACLTVVGAVGSEWKSVKNKKKENEGSAS